MENTYHYYAFISYATTDSKWAKWLQHQLSYYHIPSAVRKSKIGVPQKIRPIFIYEYDLVGNQLHEAIEQELSASKYLIVICSPSAANSKYVNREVETFIKQGRQEYIIPFIIGGEVNASNPDDECFPVALRQLMQDSNMELRGANIATNGKRQALVDIVATMLGVRRDLLWDRYKARRMKQHITMVAIAVIAMLLGLFYWDYTRPTYKYYADYVDRWGVPEGIIELDPTTYEHRARSYRFEYRKIPFWINHDTIVWRLSRVEYVNSAGQLQDHTDPEQNNRFAIQKLEYENTTGTIKNIDYCNKSGKTLLRWKISSKGDERASIIDFLGVTDMDASGYHTTISVVYPYEAKTNSKSPIKRYVLTRDSLGYITSISYHENNSNNLYSSRITDINGIHKIVFENDSLGRILVSTYYNLDGDVAKKKDGVAIKRYEYDNWGNVRTLKYYNAIGKYTVNSRLYSKVTNECDAWGNVIKEQFYNINDSLCYNSDNVAQRLIEYDKNGFPLSISILDTNGKPCVGKDGFSKIHIKCDNRGNQIENIYEGISGKPCTNAGGYASTTVEYDRWGHPTHQAIYSIDGYLANYQDGTSGWNAVYDDVGNTTQVSYFGADWNICSNNTGVASWEAEYNDRGDIISMTLFDVYGNKTLCTFGYASFSNQFLENSLITSYYDTNGNPCNTINGFHKIIYYYDDYGNAIEHRFYNNKNELCESSEGFAIFKATYDSIGNIIQMEYFDSKNNYIKNKYGVEIVKHEYDELGRVISSHFYDGDGVPMANKDGIYGYYATYDHRGNQIEYRSVDSNEELCCGNLEYAKWEREFDSKGNQLSYTAYNEENNLVAHTNGVAGWKREFNDRGLLLKTSFYDENGAICVSPDVGYACYEAQYNEALDPIMECTYDEKGNLCINPQNGCAKWVALYDDNGNKIEMLSYSEEDSLCVSKYGYARWVAEYDKDGRIIESYNYDENGNIISMQKDSKKEIPEIRKYDSHRFKYDMSEIFSGFFVLLALLFIFVLWIKEFISNKIWQNLLCLWGILSLLCIDYMLLRRFLLHYSIIPYDIHNYTWILCIVSSLCLISATIFLFTILISDIIPILKAQKYNRIRILKNSIGNIFCYLAGIMWLIYILYFMLNEGWNIYSYPL